MLTRLLLLFGFMALLPDGEPEPEPEPEDDGEDDGDQGEQTYSKSAVDRMIKRAIGKATKTTKAEIAEQLGVDSLDDAASALEAGRKKANDDASDADRATAAAAEKERKAEAAVAAANAKAQQAEIRAQSASCSSYRPRWVESASESRQSSASSTRQRPRQPDSSVIEIARKS